MDHKHKIMDRPFEPNYGSVSQVLLKQHCRIIFSTVHFLQLTVEHFHLAVLRLTVKPHQRPRDRKDLKIPDASTTHFFWNYKHLASVQLDKLSPQTIKLKIPFQFWTIQS